MAAQARDLLAAHLRPRWFPAGSLLWREGEASGVLVALDSGRVKIYRLSPEGRAVTVFLFGPGDVFGFLPFLDGRPYPAYAQALEDVEARVLPREDLLPALRRDPSLALALLGLLGRRLRDAMEQIERLATPDVLPPRGGGAHGPSSRTRGADRRVAHPSPAGLRRREAAAIGITPESLSRSLTRLVEARVLRRLGRGRFQVLDLPRLRQAARAAELP